MWKVLNSFIQNMKNKNQWLKFGLIAFAISLFSLSFVSADINFKLNMESLEASLSDGAISEHMMYVHFADNWNDFGGFLYFSNGSWEEDDTIKYYVEAWSLTYQCSTQLKWFYYNAQRWERLWPLDAETRSGWNLSESDLQMSWGIYFMCVPEWYEEALQTCISNGQKDYLTCENEVRAELPADGFAYYGSLHHVYSWQSFDLVVGVEYDTSANDFVSIEPGSSLSPTFIRVKNMYPVWFVYDYNGWVWLVWCKFDEGSFFTWGSMKNLINEQRSRWILNVFRLNSGGTGVEYSWGSLPISCNVMSTQDTLVKILVEWILWMDDDIGTYTKFWWIGNSSDAKMQYFGSKSVSNVAFMNYVAKEAELLCRWRWSNVSAAFNDQVICWNGGEIPSSTSSQVMSNGKTLIVKNADVIVTPAAFIDNNYYDIFILSGNLIIDETNAENFLIKMDGFPSDSSFTESQFNAYAYSMTSNTGDIEDCVGDSGSHPNCDLFDFNKDGNIDNYDIDRLSTHGLSNVSTVASVIKWNFIVNWSVMWTWWSTPGKLSKKYFIYWRFTTKDSISKLEKVFLWRCNNDVGTNGYFCPQFESNHYQNAALVIIDQNYASPFFQS